MIQRWMDIAFDVSMCNTPLCRLVQVKLLNIVECRRWNSHRIPRNTHSWRFLSHSQRSDICKLKTYARALNSTRLLFAIDTVNGSKKTTHRQQEQQQQTMANRHIVGKQVIRTRERARSRSRKRKPKRNNYSNNNENN